MMYKFTLAFFQTQNGGLLCTAIDYSFVDWDGPCDHLRVASWENIFELDTSTAASKFHDCIQARVDGSFPYCNYQLKPHFFLYDFQMLVPLG